MLETIGKEMLIVRKIVTMIGGYSDCTGQCGIASALLCDRLQKKGFKPKIASATKEPHVSVILAGHILDVTATQFGPYPALYICPVSQKPKKGFYKWKDKFDSPAELIAYQKRVKWPKCQIADKKLFELCNSEDSDEMLKFL